MSRSACLPMSRRGVAVWCLHLPTSTSCSIQYQPSTTCSTAKQLTVFVSALQIDPRGALLREHRSLAYTQVNSAAADQCIRWREVKGKGSPYSITERRVSELIPVLNFLAVSLQVTWVMNAAVGCHYFPPGLQLPSQPLRGLLNLKRAATNFAAWWTEAQWVWTVSLRLLPDSVAAAIWTQAPLRLSPAR